mgnify:CR=1 FL=1
MAAFDRIKSGIPGLDEALDNIRLGDNVVWNVTNLNEFSYFVGPYVKQAKEDNRNLIYIRFSNDPPLIEMSEEDFRLLEMELYVMFVIFTSSLTDFGFFCNSPSLTLK